MPSPEIPTIKDLVRSQRLLMNEMMNTIEDSLQADDELTAEY